MLVKLYALPDAQAGLSALAEQGIHVRRPHPSARDILAKWVRQRFDESWAIGCEQALASQPARCYIAVETMPAGAPAQGLYDLPPEHLLGFACYDIASKGMFGAMGVDEAYRRRGIGTALLLACLYAMKDEGYAYAVIGWAGSLEFYAHAVGATVIPDSEPGIFRGQLIDDL